MLTTQTIDWLQKFVILVLLVGVIVLGVKSCDAGRELDTTNSLLTAANSELVIWKNAEGQSSAKITAMETQSYKDFLSLSSKDATIIKLQSLVNNYKSKLNKEGSATIIETQGEIDTKVPTITTIDTTKVKPNECPSPVYTSKFNLDNWVKGDIVADKDSTSIKLTFREELDVIIGRDKTGFLGLGKGKAFVQVNLHNPYNEVTQLKTYSVKEPSTKYWHIGIGVMYGVGSSFTPQLILGAGLMWTPINF